MVLATALQMRTAASGKGVFNVRSTLFKCAFRKVRASRGLVTSFSSFFCFAEKHLAVRHHFVVYVSVVTQENF